MQKLEQHNYIM